MQPGTLIALAVLVLTAASAMAQSNVTIYGRFNVSVEDQKALGKNTTRLVNNSSRIGFKGTEDLGGSLKAGFVLEHGFNADTGTTSGAFWGRQSEVNLSGGSGMLRLGNFTSEAYYATADYISLRNHDTGTSADVLYAYLGRDVNKIAYRTPEFGGATLELATSLKETAANGTYDIALNWGQGPLALGAGYQNDGTAKQFAVRAFYDTAPFAFGAYVQRDNDTYAAGNRTTFRLSGAYTMGSSEFHLNLGKAGDCSGLADSDATQWTVGYNLNLSKRTKVYTFYTKVDDSKGVYGGDFSSLALGLSHNF